MKLRVQVGTQPGELVVEEVTAAGKFRFRHVQGAGAVEAEVSVVEVEPGVYSVLWDGRSIEVRVFRNQTHSWVEVDGHSLRVDVRDPRELGADLAAGAAGGRRNIVAPMPGRVIRLLAEEGQAVEQGQGILVVEAMKMQNHMQSPKAGRIVSIPVKPGDAVSAGQVLATVD